jgi:arylsulfatase A-like enzyme
MSETNKPLAGLSNEIENVVIFVCDALRWDYHPESVRARGVTFKTVASSLFTAASFPSMISGLYAHRLGIFSFGSLMDPATPAMTNISGVTFSLWTETAWTSFQPPETGPLYRVLNTRQRVSLDVIEPPFVYLEDDKGAHAPYGLPFTEYEKPTTTFFQEYGGQGVEKLRSMYRSGVEQSVDLFETRLDVLAERGLLDSTLVIFTSDHGDLLGEYGGLVGHAWFASPELVFVPTTFIHPSLPDGVTVTEKVIRHVDLFPTILSCLNRRVPSGLDGISLLDCEMYPDHGINYCRKNRPEKGKKDAWLGFAREERSVWDWGGGYVLRSDSLPVRVLSTVYYSLIRNSETKAFLGAHNQGRPVRDILQDCGTLLRFGSLSRRKCLEPLTPEVEAQRILASIVSGEPKQATSWMSDRDDDEQVLQRLRDLGYIDQ